MMSKNRYSILGAALLGTALSGLALSAQEAAPAYTIRVFDEPQPDGLAPLGAGQALNMHFAAEPPEPRLSALAWREGGSVLLAGWSNYALFARRAEYRIFSGARLVATLPARIGRPVRHEGALPEDARVVLRLYGANGRYDETAPRRILSAPPAPGLLLAAESGNDLARRAIGLSGRAVAIEGSGIAPGQHVRFAGIPVPVRADGRFSSVQIVPKGSRVLEVEITDSEGRVLAARRQPVSIADEDGFRVGIADLTIGRNRVSGPIMALTGDSSARFSGDYYRNGRLAFYLREHTRNGWKITASADTGEGPVDQLFSNFLASDPRSFLRRLDPRSFYPTYGDDSTAIADAPTDGKLFLKAERGGLALLWGSFKTEAAESRFSNFSRALYGARVSYARPGAEDGSGALRGEIFAAEPGTVQGREEFRGTGGSLYFLRNQDILRGSEKVWIEDRDPVTGVLISRRALIAGQDYELNAIQGRLQLTSPLAGSGSGGTLVGGAGAGTARFLVVAYEYSPAATASGEQVIGGSLEARPSARLSLGANAIRQQNGSTDQTLLGLTAQYRITPGSALSFELAHSRDAGAPTWRSIDGGFNFTLVPGGGASSAAAGRIGLSLDLAEAGWGEGSAKLYWQKRQAGFSGPGAQTGEDVTQFGVDLATRLSARTDLRFVAESSLAPSQNLRSAELDLGRQVSDRLKLGFGLKADEVNTVIPSASSTLSTSGTRLDAVLRADYDPGANWTAYGYLQGTLSATGSRARNDRLGFGGSYRAGERLTLQGEISGGSGGLGASAGLDWQLDERTKTYLSYTLSPDNADAAMRGQAGRFTYGGTRQVTDNVYVLAEQTYLHGAGPNGTTTSFGLDITPDNSWLLGGRLEFGSLADPVSGDIERRALSFNAAYSRERISYSGVLEWRVDTSSAERRETIGLRNSLSYQIRDDWRFLGKLSAARSQSSNPGVANTEFVELVTGLAYRPIEDDRLNALLRYTYLYDTGSASASSLAQRSHVFSGDAIYELNEHWSLGGKLGLRMGDVRLPGGGWARSDALLAALRADYKLRNRWSLLGEYRILTTRGSGATRTGAVLGIYRHMNEKLRLGIGYSAADFSDDLTHQNYDTRGLFLNLIGKF